VLACIPGLAVASMYECTHAHVSSLRSLTILTLGLIYRVLDLLSSEGLLMMLVHANVVLIAVFHLLIGITCSRRLVCNLALEQFIFCKDLAACFQQAHVSNADCCLQQVMVSRQCILLWQQALPSM
jgi:hypothetical protein